MNFLRVQALMAKIFKGGDALKPLLTWLVFASASAFAQQTVEVLIRDYRFSPTEIRIKAGDTVRWVNREKRTSHSVLFPGEDGLESDRIFPDEQWQRTFTEKGAYSYRCGPHEEMKGLVVVE